jgi:Transglycosylase SLT domain
MSQAWKQEMLPINNDWRLDATEKKQLLSIVEKNKDKLPGVIMNSLINTYKIWNIINSVLPYKMNNEQVILTQLTYNILIGEWKINWPKIKIDGFIWPDTIGAIWELKKQLLLPSKEVSRNSKEPKLPVRAPEKISKPISKKTVETSKKVEVIAKEPVIVPEKKEKELIKAKEIKTTNNKIEWGNLDMSEIIKDDVDAFIAYLSHQQWATGAKDILDAVLFGKSITTTRFNNMRGNVWDDYKPNYGTLSPQWFVKYRFKKLKQKMNAWTSKASKYDEIFNTIGEKTKVSAELIKWIAYAESTLKNEAKWKFRWLMQLSSSVAATHGVKDRLDPYQNVLWGLKYMKANLLERQWKYTLLQYWDLIRDRWKDVVLWTKLGGSNLA